jgi:hypothetical protein
MSEASELFESTFSALERTLTVALITEWNLIACSEETTAQELFTAREDISQIPKRPRGGSSECGFVGMNMPPSTTRC